MMKHDFRSGPLREGPLYPFTRHSVPVHTVVIHYTWAIKSSMARVWRWHKERGFNGPGYHILLRKDTSVEYGRPEWAQGAGASGHNDGYLHIAYEGGRIPGDDKNGHDTRTPEMTAELVQQIRGMQDRHPSLKKVVGHRQVTATQCPGFDVDAWWNDTEAKPAAAGAPAVTEQTGQPGVIAAIVHAIIRAFRGIKT